MKVFTDASSEFNTKNPNAEFHLLGDWSFMESGEYKRSYDRKEYILRLIPEENHSVIDIVFDSPFDLQNFKSHIRLSEKRKPLKHLTKTVIGTMLSIPILAYLWDKRK